jgi:hypothetical protein
MLICLSVLQAKTPPKTKPNNEALATKIQVELVKVCKSLVKRPFTKDIALKTLNFFKNKPVNDFFGNVKSIYQNTLILIQPFYALTINSILNKNQI